MEKYDYRENVLEDVREYISNNYDREELKALADDLDELEEKLDDEMWTADSVTGNGSGSYTFNAWQAEENLCHNLDLVQEVGREFGELDLTSPESCDVSIRCYYLRECINEVLNEDYSDLYDEEEEYEEEEDEGGELEALVNKLSEIKGQFFVVKKKELNSEIDFDNLEYFENLCNAISEALNYETSGWVVIDDTKKILWDETLISSSTIERWFMAYEEEVNMYRDGLCGIGDYLSRRIVH